MLINYNIWKVFYLLLLTSIFLVSYFLYSNYNEMQEKYHTQVHHYTEIIAKTVDSDIGQHEMLLTTLGNQLLLNNSYKNSIKTGILLDSLLKQNPHLVGFGLADIDGNMIAASSNIKNINKINFLKNKITNESFKKTLSSNILVVGRTYFFKATNTWTIPLRKAIRDENGVVIGVMTTGLKNAKDMNFLDTFAVAQDKRISIVKDFDYEGKMYRQYMSRTDNISRESIYNTPIPNKIYEVVTRAIDEKYNFPFKELRTNKQTISIEFSDSRNDQIVSGLTYNKKYKLWILVQGYSSEINNEFYKTVLVYVVFLLFTFMVFFILFQNIALSDKRKKEELIYHAEHDALTSLPNRTYMYSHIEEWKAQNIEKYNVLYIDLDNFKNINDKFGHTIGDEILVEVANRLKLFFDKEDMLIRQGGDEFIVFRESHGEGNIEKCLSSLIESIAKVYHIENKEFRIGMSVGLAQYPIDALSVEELLSLADTAMYEAKKRKNSFCTFSESMRYSSILKSDIENELRGALENSEFWMTYQPQINADGTLYGVEALVRWKNEKLGMVGPDKFIVIAEETGLMREIGEFIMVSSLREIKEVQSQLGISFSLSINISVIQLIEADFLDRILELIKSENFDKNILTLEITESLSIEDLDYVLPTLDSLRKEGIEISLDDFGTGYSSLSLLKKLPINELKIDKSFIDEILYHKNGKSLVKSIIDIGKSFNMKTLAEGVESLPQVELLKEFDCDIFQGYYYSKPLNKHDLVEFLKNKQKEEK